MADVVTEQNEEMYRRAFGIATGHSMECVTETVNDMAALLASVCEAHGGLPINEIAEQFTVEQFDIALRKILDNKDCACNNKR
jgi:hypothetical protein